MAAKRRRRKRRSLASVQASIYKAIESAARKGKAWRSDKRVKVLLKEQARIRAAVDRNQAW
jgi:hypothetical protein